MSVKLNVYNQQAERVKTLDLNDSVFAVKANADLIHQALVTQTANERQVLAHTKTKPEVRGGGKKPWRQKGTGRARSGSSRSPLWIGGGVTFGPRNDRNFSLKINKKMRQKAILMVFSDKVNNNALAIVDAMNFSEYKTKNFNEILSAFETKVWKSNRRSALFIVKKEDEMARVSGRNLKDVEIINLDNLNIYDILKHRNVVLTEEVASVINKRYGKEK